MIFLLKGSNQYNIYNLILWLIAIALEYVQSATEAAQKQEHSHSYRNDNAYNSSFWLIAWEVSYIPNNQTRKHNPNHQNIEINMVFISNTKFMPLQLRQRKFCSIHIRTSQ